MPFVADLHLHSSYAYATSSALTLENLALWARLKGIDLLATADFSHPHWFEELKKNLSAGPEGLYQYGGINFVIGTEVSCVFRQGGRGRRVHLLVFAPSMETAARLNLAWSNFGKLQSDGRPTLAMSVRDLAELVMETDANCVVVPAHAWTPWYGIFGSKSGFDSLSEAFGDMVDEIPAIETGLSSDPEMNWALGELAGKTIVSFSDAHSLPKLARELTVFDEALGYAGLVSALRNGRVAYTVEMYPEEGKYHYDGHRKCDIVHHPDVTHQQGADCPACGRPLTLGVLNRTLSLGDGEQSGGRARSGPSVGDLPEGAIASSVGRPPFVRMVPLVDIIAAVKERGANTRGVMKEYERITGELGTELRTLLWAAEDELEKAAGPALTAAIMRTRRGEITIEPGYDGVYGRVSIA